MALILRDSNGVEIEMKTIILNRVIGEMDKQGLDVVLELCELRISRK